MRHCAVAILCMVIIVVVIMLITRRKQSAPRKVSEKVVLLGLDGLGVQNLKQVSTPNLDSMHYQESSIDPHSRLSGPNWVGILTGYDSDTSGIYNNECKLPEHKTLFDEYTSAVYTQWDVIKCYSNNIDRYSFQYFTDRIFNESLLNDTLQGNESFVFIHIDVLDYYSHTLGADSNEFEESLKAIDSELMPLLMPYDLVVTADHGSKRGGTGHSRDRVPILTNGVTTYSHVYNIIREMLGWSP